MLLYTMTLYTIHYDSITPYSSTYICHTQVYENLAGILWSYDTKYSKYFNFHIYINSNSIHSNSYGNSYTAIYTQ